MKQSHNGLLHNKAWFLGVSGSTSAGVYLPKNCIYSKHKRWMHKSIILPQIKLWNHNPVKNKEMKTKTAQTQKVWQEFSVL